jgi:hypothetical protein
MPVAWGEGAQVATEQPWRSRLRRKNSYERSSYHHVHIGIILKIGPVVELLV